MGDTKSAYRIFVVNILNTRLLGRQGKEHEDAVKMGCGVVVRVERQRFRAFQLY
jgi:hypothetical protein